MILHAATGLPRPALRTLADIQRRRADLLGIHLPINQATSRAEAWLLRLSAIYKLPAREGWGDL